MDGSRHESGVVSRNKGYGLGPAQRMVGCLQTWSLVIFFPYHPPSPRDETGVNRHSQGVQEEERCTGIIRQAAPV